LSVEIGDGVLEHRAMRRRARVLKIAERASSRQHQRIASCPSGDFVCS
jgi:hypothetical protein